MGAKGYVGVASLDEGIFVWAGAVGAEIELDLLCGAAAGGHSGLYGGALLQLYVLADDLRGGLTEACLVRLPSVLEASRHGDGVPHSHVLLHVDTWGAA